MRGQRILAAAAVVLSVIVGTAAYAVVATSKFDGLIVICDIKGSCPTGSLATGAGDLMVEGDVEADGALNVAGASTLTGANTVTGLQTHGSGEIRAVLAITDTTQLALADCGKVITVSAGIDTKSITLPAASTAAGCEYDLQYIGADGGALLDITPLDSGNADGIEGGCTLASSVVTFSGTADADIGLTKATILTGDHLTITNCGAAMWCAHNIQGICANN